MTPLVHNVLSLIVVAGLLLGLRYAIAFEKALSRLALVVVCLVGLLLLLGALSALQFREDNFGKIQLWTWTVFLHLPLFLGGVALLLWQRARGIAGINITFMALLVLIAVDAFLIEPRWLEISRVTLTTAKVQQPLRIVVLADIQTDRSGAYEERALRLALAEQPDLVLLAGDYIHLGRRSRSYAEEGQVLNGIMHRVGLAAPFGVYAIQGNVDSPGAWPVVFARLPVTVFEATTQVDVGPVVLTALSLQDSFAVQTTVAPLDKFHVVLGHSPNFSLGAVEGDLLIAGHTHGGQVRLPFIGPIVTLTAAPRAWAAGVTPLAPGKTLIVSRGVGLERAHAPRLRFLCRPEVVVIDIMPVG